MTHSAPSVKRADGTEVSREGKNMKTPKIKIGDRVKIIECSTNYAIHVGRIGIVEWINNDGSYNTSVCDASKVKLLSQLKKKKVGRPKGSKNGYPAVWTEALYQTSLGSARPKPPEVTFPLTTLPDGTEMFCIPSKEYVISDMQIGDNYVVVKRKK